jgi:two-component system chemotaxis response regulator CheY
MNGIDLTKHVRQTAKYKFTPILMLTTESQSDMMQQGKAAGATGWIVKPFEPEKLLTVVKKLVV